MYGCYFTSVGKSRKEAASLKAPLNRKGGQTLFEKVFFFFFFGLVNAFFFPYLERGGFKFLGRVVRGNSCMVQE